MYDYTYYDTAYTTSNNAAGILALMGTFSLVLSLISIFSIVCMWIVFKKAGKNGWEAIIPIYNIIVLLEIVELPTWYIVLFIVPIAQLYAVFKIYIELAHKFGKTTGFGIGMAILNPIFMAILAFDKNCVYGNNAVSAQNSSYGTQQPNYQNWQPVDNNTNSADANQQVTNQNVNVTMGAGLNAGEPQSTVQSQPVNNVVEPQSVVQPQPVNNVVEPQSTVQPQPVNNVVEPQSTVQPQPVNNVVEPQSAVQLQQTFKVCPNCGAQVDSNADTCFMCGNKV